MSSTDNVAASTGQLRRLKRTAIAVTLCALVLLAWTFRFSLLVLYVHSLCWICPTGYGINSDRARFAASAYGATLKSERDIGDAVVRLEAFRTRAQNEAAFYIQEAQLGLINRLHHMSSDAACRELARLESSGELSWDTAAAEELGEIVYAKRDRILPYLNDWASKGSSRALDDAVDIRASLREEKRRNSQLHPQLIPNPNDPSLTR